MAKKLSLFVRYLLPKAPLLIRTTVKHFTVGSPKPSWTYKFTITVALLQAFVAHLNEVPVAKSQEMSRMNDQNAPVHSDALATEATIPHQYRALAVKHLQALFRAQKIDDAQLGWDWKTLPKDLLEAEWTEAREKDEKHSEGRTVLYLHGGGYFLGSIKTHRWATWALAKRAGARVFSVEYRLAPESPFPAAVMDAMAAYLYLLNPPSDSGLSPVDRKNIVWCGDSAGGGLVYATMLAVRDAGLPMPAGIVGWSPWLDLLHSMPSVLTNAGSDYLPAEGFTQGGQGSLKQVAKLSATLGPEEDILRHAGLPEIQYYARNAVLDCKYVSPLVETNLEGACPMLMVVGDGEMLRDEAVAFCARRENSSSGLHLRLYDDQPHVFPMFEFLPSAQHAIQETADFICSVTLGGAGVSGKSYERVSVDGTRRPLDLEESLVPGWEKRVGRLGGGKDALSLLC